jgi:hypothetical protein
MKPLHTIEIPATAYQAIAQEARRRHRDDLAAAEAAAEGGMVVTADMCACGMSTGSYKNELCRLLSQLHPARIKNPFAGVDPADVRLAPDEHVEMYTPELQRFFDRVMTHLDDNWTWDDILVTDWSTMSDFTMSFLDDDVVELDRAIAAEYGPDVARWLRTRVYDMTLLELGQYLRHHATPQPAEP